MRLYHSPGSRATRVMWTLEEIGEPYEVTIVSREDRASEDYRERVGCVNTISLQIGRIQVSVQPLGRVPVFAAKFLRVERCEAEAVYDAVSGTRQVLRKLGEPMLAAAARRKRWPVYPPAADGRLLLLARGRRSGDRGSTAGSARRRPALCDGPSPLRSVR
jgi:hypothetical protein